MEMESQTDAAQMGRFGNVDATNQADKFIAFLERVELAPGAIAVRKRSYELLRPQPGLRVVDVGCGTGRAVAEMKELQMEATGVDVSEQMISAARRRYPEGDFRVGGAGALPFENGSLDRYRAERLYQHLDDPAAAIAEAQRVLASGGRIVLVDQDWDSAMVDSDDMETTRRLLRAFSDSIANRWMGRRLRALLLDAGFEDVAVEINTWVRTEEAPLRAFFPSAARAAVDSGALSQAEADAWLAEQERRLGADRLFFAIPLFLASGRKP